MATAYEGDKPYIFVSYSHKDKREVMRYIDALEEKGFLVWFDGGIEAGSEWPEYIAQHLVDSSCVLAFVTSDFVESSNCRRELTFAQDQEKEQLVVFLRPEDELNLTPGLKMQLGHSQTIRRDNFDYEDDCIEALCAAKIIADCVPASESINPHEKQPEEPVLEQNKALNKRSKRTGWITSFLEMMYIPFSLWFSNYLFEMDLSVWWMIVLMALPHIFIALFNKYVFYKPLAKKLTQERANKDKFDDAITNVMLFFILSTLISIVACAVTIPVDKGFFIRLLMMVGYNVIPTLVAGGIILYYDSVDTDDIDDIIYSENLSDDNQ